MTTPHDPLVSSPFTRGRGWLFMQPTQHVFHTSGKPHIPPAERYNMRSNRKYEVEIVARTNREIEQIDLALESLAAQGIWVHSIRETHPPTGAVLTPLPLSEVGNDNVPFVGI